MPLFKDRGILGINARNLRYIRAYNPSQAIRLADNKLKTKNFLSARGISVPRLYGTIRTREDLKKYDFLSLPERFVLKPNSGSGGEGILPIWGRKEGGYSLAGGVQEMSQAELEEHIEDILEGRFSMSGVRDIAFFEQLIICDERLARFAYKGLPDIRVVVFNLVPVMAMLRLPTRRSKGKANLHQGAVGVGIDIAKGEATHIVEGTTIIESIPGVGPIRGLKIPYWDDILLTSSKVQLETNLGYVAVDIAIDQNTGPVLLEINARAGLGVQVANLAPLRRRLERVTGIKVQNPEKGVRMAKDMFGNVAEREIKSRTGKEVVGIFEPVKVLVESKPYRLMARLNPNVERTVVDTHFAQKIGLMDSLPKASQSSFKLKFILAGQRVQTVARVKDLESSDYKMVIGRRDLTNFLVDPSRSEVSSKTGSSVLDPEEKREEKFSLAKRKSFRALDELLCFLDEKIKLLYHLRPLNIASEQTAFLAGLTENPKFVYPELKFDPYELRESLEEMVIDDSGLGHLFERKREEIFLKIDLLEHRCTPLFMDKSVQLFGEVTPELLMQAHQRLSQKPAVFSSPGASISAEKAAQRFQQFFKDEGLNHWTVKLKEDIVSDCIAGKKNVLFVRSDARFDETRLAMVIAHEIETHIYTAENGKRQPYRLFQRGTGGYLKTQEGLAIYNQERTTSHLTEKHFWSATLVVIIHEAQQHSFRELYELLRTMGYSEQKAFQFALKVKRGLENTSLHGAFTKDLVYFEGRAMIENFVAQGGDLKRLYLGKIDLPSLSMIESMPLLIQPKYYPLNYS